MFALRVENKKTGLAKCWWGDSKNSVLKQGCDSIRTDLADVSEDDLIWVLADLGAKEIIFELKLPSYNKKEITDKFFPPISMLP